MQQIADWLKKLGMSEYAERFAKNDIEIDNLTELTITTWKGSASPARSSRRRAGQGRLIQSLEQRAAASGPEASERHGPTVPAPPLNNGKRSTMCMQRCVVRQARAAIKKAKNGDQGRA
jgi:hypothetical protein